MRGSNLVGLFVSGLAVATFVVVAPSWEEGKNPKEESSTISLVEEQNPKQENSTWSWFKNWAESSQKEIKKWQDTEKVTCSGNVRGEKHENIPPAEVIIHAENMQEKYKPNKGVMEVGFSPVDNQGTFVRNFSISNNRYEKKHLPTQDTISITCIGEEKNTLPDK